MLNIEVFPYSRIFFQFKVKKVMNSDGKVIPSLVKSDGKVIPSLVKSDGKPIPSLLVSDSEVLVHFGPCCPILVQCFASFWAILVRFVPCWSILVHISAPRLEGW